MVQNKVGNAISFHWVVVSFLSFSNGGRGVVVLGWSGGIYSNCFCQALKLEINFFEFA